MIGKFLKRKNCLPAAVLLIGAGGIIGQLMLIRVLMVIFLGNELSLSLVIATWLLFEGAGSWLGGKFTGAKTEIDFNKTFLIIFTSYPVILTGSVLLARYLGQGMPGLVPGEAMNLAQMFLTSILTIGITGVVHGSLFPLAAQIFQEQADKLPVSRAYIIEIIGTIAGGLVFAFLLAPALNSTQISLGLLILYLPVSFWLVLVFHKKEPGLKVAFVLLIIFLTFLVFFPSATSYLHRTSVSGLWPQGEIIDYRNSAYGNIVTVTRQQEETIFYDGRPTMSLPHPDTARLQDYAYLTLGAHTSPEDVLLVGGGMGGLISFLLDHPLENLVFAELDPELLQVAETIDSEILQREFADSRTEIMNRDGRLYLNRTERNFDLIMLGEIDTETLQTNRFFTQEFFQLVAERLSEQGMLAFTLAGSQTYLGDELELLNSSLYHTAGEVFAEVKLIPGDKNIILASQQEINLLPEKIARRLQKRDLYGGMFNTSYLQFRLNRQRLEEFNARLEKNPVRINRDFSPAGFFYGLLNWSRAFAPEVLAFFYNLAANISYILFAGAGLVVLLGWRLLWFSRNYSANRLTYAITTSGGAAMSFDLFTLFAFQSLFGHIYQLNGLFIAAFMGGMYFGGRFSYGKIIERKKQLLKPFLQLEFTVLLLLMIFPLFVTMLRELMFLPAASILAAISCVVFAVISGGVVGAQFPLAVNLLPAKFKQQAGSAAGRLYTADLFGGWLAGMLVGIILFPLLGLTYTMFLLAILKLSSLLLIYVGASV